MSFQIKEIRRKTHFLRILVLLFIQVTFGNTKTHETICYKADLSSSILSVFSQATSSSSLPIWP